ncbi:ribonuclease PH [Pseudomonadota bacterium]
MRPSGRGNNKTREVRIETNVNNYAEGSCLIKQGNTHIICTATVEKKVPPFLRGKGSGWVIAEYNMIPRATQERVQRDGAGTRPNSRKLEIQRLIGRSLRGVIDTIALGERQIIVDCDVIQADGGTRCASITGGFVAMYLAVENLLKRRKIKYNPINGYVSAISCGIYKETPILDLDYDEDSTCEADVNFIMNEEGKIIEVQGTAEGNPFTFEQIQSMYTLAKTGCDYLLEIQKKALGKIYEF